MLSSRNETNLFFNSLFSQINGVPNQQVSDFSKVLTFFIPLTYSKIIYGIISKSLFLPGIHHIVPNDFVSKYQLIKLIAKYFDRRDLEVLPFSNPESINRALATSHPKQNLNIWQASGYDEIPDIDDMIREYSEWMRCKNV